jgi:hypothetical protein
MRAKALSIEFNTPIEQELNSWLEEVGEIRIDHTVVVNESNGGHKLIIFYSEATSAPVVTGKKAVVCTQCRKNPPANGLKTCEECQKYQSEYRKKRKEESKARYP